MTIRWPDHTADLAVEVEADGLDACLAELVRATTQAIAGDSAIEPAERRTVRVEADDHAELAVALANEVIYLWDADRLLVADARFEHRPGVTIAALRGEPFDPERHAIEREFKAATHHTALCEAVGDRWRARVVYDL